MKLEAIQQALESAGVDGWLFYDFHHRDPISYSILGLDPASMTSRRWFYWVPARGEPVKLAHRVEPHKLDALPGRQDHYLAWTELHDKLRKILSGAAKVAMQYSPLCHIPYVSLVDAGTVELIRSLGPEIVSSGGLVQQFEAVSGAEGLASHQRAGKLIQKIKDESFAMMGRALERSESISEYDIARFILGRFHEEGLDSDGASPIVGFNDHPADPHFEPTATNTHTLRPGDTILLDLWAHVVSPPGIYYDVTWCGFAGKEPPAEYSKIFGIVCEARDAALHLVRERFASGTPCHGYEVDRVCRAVVEQAGYGDRFLHRTGHSIGVEVHGNGANIDDLETRDERALVPGACFSIEPGIYLEGKMAVRTEIDVFITPEGKPEVFGPIQRDLLLIG